MDSHVSNHEGSWRGVRDCTNEVCEEHQADAFCTQRGGPYFGGPNEAWCVNCLIGQDIEEEKEQASTQAGFAVGSEVLPFEERLGEQDAGKGTITRYCPLFSSKPVPRKLNLQSKIRRPTRSTM